MDPRKANAEKEPPNAHNGVKEEAQSAGRKQSSAKGERSPLEIRTERLNEGGDGVAHIQASPRSTKKRRRSIDDR
jgi:hypothetical protein